MDFIDIQLDEVRERVDHERLKDPDILVRSWPPLDYCQQVGTNACVGVLLAPGG